MTEFKRTLITSALPYANGPVHIGHLAGVYVPADIYARFLRMNGEEVAFIGGSDEHGVPITLKAKNEGVTPQDIVDKYHGMIKDSFRRFGISFDIYARTSDPIHYQTASEIFLKLYQDGKFIEKTSEQYYDAENKQFLADRYITGTCPKCGFEKAYGDQCESCGSALSPNELINPKSMISGNVPQLKETKHWYLPLGEYEDWLKDWLLEGHKEWKSNVYGQCKSWIDGGLQARAVTRDLDWGVPVPVEGAENKVLYVWFDAPIGYISATKEWTPDWEKWWKDPETKLVHFIGKDNIVFHCIIFPIILKAEGSYILPENVPANEFLNLEGDKISTSRNWAVWLHEYLDEFPCKEDVLKYVLTANAPETKDNDFTWKDFQTRNNNELVAVLGNFVNRALVLTQKYYDGRVPAAGELTETDVTALVEISIIKAEVEKSISQYRFREALKYAMDLARLGNKYLADAEPWKVVKKVKHIANFEEFNEKRCIPRFNELNKNQQEKIENHFIRFNNFKNKRFANNLNENNKKRPLEYFDNFSVNLINRFITNFYEFNEKKHVDNDDNSNNRFIDNFDEFNKKRSLDSLDNFNNSRIDRFINSFDGLDLVRQEKYMLDFYEFKEVNERVATILNVCLQITANLTIIFAPFLPFSMDKLRIFLNMDELNWSNLGRTDLLTAGHQTNTPELLFEKIEDEVIEKQVNKLLATKKANEVANAQVSSAKGNCTFDDFNKMDIRTGTILEAERVPKTKKLLKLTIDTGIDKRTVVSGIAEYYSPEEIIGQQVSILVNLEPKELKGIQSQGMILMAQDADGSLKFVTPVSPIKNGSEIK